MHGNKRDKKNIPVPSKCAERMNHSLALLLLSALFNKNGGFIPNNFNAILLSGLAAKMSLRYVRALPPLEAVVSVECKLACLVKVSTVDCWS